MQREGIVMSDDRVSVPAWALKALMHLAGEVLDKAPEEQDAVRVAAEALGLGER